MQPDSLTLKVCVKAYHGRYLVKCELDLILMDLILMTCKLAEIISLKGTCN